MEREQAFAARALLLARAYSRQAERERRQSSFGRGSEGALHSVTPSLVEGESAGLVFATNALPGITPPTAAREMRPERFPQRRDVRSMTPQPEQESAVAPEQTASQGTVSARALPQLSAEAQPTLANPDVRSAANKTASMQVVPAWLSQSLRHVSAAQTTQADLPKRSAEGAHTAQAMAAHTPVVAGTGQHTPALLAVFSLSGGVGRTSLTAALGRLLSTAGRRVFLADIATQAMLHFHFGLPGEETGVVRTFTPHRGTTDRPLSMARYEPAKEATAEALLRDLWEEPSIEHGIIDLSPTDSHLLCTLVACGAEILVPVTAEVSSSLSLHATEHFFAGLTDSVGQPVRPHYVLTQFDAPDPLHLHLREVMRRKLGSQLLPFAVRRSELTAKALAEGQTVIDAAPQAGISDDLRCLAEWVQSLDRAKPSHRPVQLRGRNQSTAAW